MKFYIINLINMSSLGIIIQARSGSKRFPKKIFQIIGDKTVLEHVVLRVKKTKFKKKIIIATTKKKNDKIIKEIAKKNKCEFFFGNDTNVLKRFFSAAKKFKIKNIMRICADSPFIDPSILERVLKKYRKDRFDLVSNTRPRTFPKGMSVEIFSFDALKRAYNIAKTKSEKEHVTKVMYENKRIFNVKSFKSKYMISKYKFVLDYPKELTYLRKIYDNLVKKKIKEKFCLKNLISIAKTI